MYYNNPRPPTPARCLCGAVALVYDETRGWCGRCYLDAHDAPATKDERNDR